MYTEVTKVVGYLTLEYVEVQQLDVVGTRQVAGSPLEGCTAMQFLLTSTIRWWL